MVQSQHGLNFSHRRITLSTVGIVPKIAELGLSEKKDLGRLMKAVMADHRGALDGKLVQRLAAELLA